MTVMADSGQPISLAVAATGLPGSVTTFIGRVREIAEVKRLLTQARLVTLTGTGGCGKTRLALQLAGELLEEYPDGVAVVELGAMADPSLIPQVVASNLEVREQAREPILTTLVENLKEQRLLVVLDNCEHLIEACARVAATLLRNCPALQILATSREPLGIGGEVVWRVPSLAVPRPNALPPFGTLPQYEGIRLFVDRASAAQPTFRLTPQNAAAVVQLCHHLDGIPLALELAAARTRALTVEQIALRLDDRFSLLSGGSRIDLPRHQTLRALIDWSYDRLPEPECRLFNRLAVFAGGWTLEAAEAICGDVGDGSWHLDSAGLEHGDAEGALASSRPITTSAGPPIPSEGVVALLAQLVDKSLVVAEEGLGFGRNPDHAARYRLLETLQQYAAEKLRESGEEAIVRRRHQYWFLALAEKAVAQLEGAEGRAWAERLEIDHDNLRAALVPSRGTIKPADGTDEDLAELRLRLAGALWPFWEKNGHWSEGRRWLEDVLAVPSPRSAARAKVLHGAATLADSQGDSERATILLKEALAVYEEVGDLLGVAFTMDRLGQAAYRRRDLHQAMMLAEKSLALYRVVGDEVLIADALDTLGHLIQRQGDPERARTLFEQSLTLFRKLADKRGVAAVLRSLAQLADDQGDYARVAILAEESIALFREVGDTFGLGSLLVYWAFAAVKQGQFELAERLVVEGLREPREMGDRHAIASKLRSLATVVYERHDFQRAAWLWQESLALYRDFGDKPGIVACLFGLGVLASERGEPEQALQLLAAADALRTALGVGLLRADPAGFAAAVKAARTRVGDEVFTVSWVSGRMMSLEQAVSEALALEILPPSEPASAGESRDRAAASPRRLTRREVDVLRLIAAGRTNNGIAAELVVSLSTIERHISHLYGKIGARGRADATAYALRHGLG
jgi:non-specific serine/threonine protein kinase